MIFTFNKNKYEKLKMLTEITNKEIGNQELFGAKINTIINNANESILNGKNPDKLRIVLSIPNFANHKQNVMQLINYVSKKISDMPVKLNAEVIVTYGVEPTYTAKDTSALNEINNHLASTLNTTLKFPINPSSGYYEAPYYQELDTLWEFNQVLNANLTLNKVVNTIQNANLSPYEKFLAAYSFVTKFVYASEEDNQPGYLSRKLVPILQSGKIVCVGFDQMLVTMLKQLDIPFMPIIVQTKDKESSHKISAVKIIDSKYGINGVFITDPTSDAYKPKEDVAHLKSYFFHLLPINEYCSVFNMMPYYFNEKTLLQLSNQNLSQQEFNNNFNISYNQIKEKQIPEQYDYFIKQLRDCKFIDINIKYYTEIISDRTSEIALPDNILLTKDEVNDIVTKYNHKLLNEQPKITAQIENLHKLCAHPTPISTQTFSSAYYNVLKNIDFMLFYPDTKQIIDLEQNYNVPTATDQEIKSFVKSTINYNIKDTDKLLQAHPQLQEYTPFACAEHTPSK